ncbi:MAG: TadE/TadG family type IV pilus assembly protein [Candidatus Binataceae bacterium]
MRGVPGWMRRWRRGQSTVEMALSASFLVLLLLGACDLGYLLYMQIEMTDAARAGAEYGSSSLIAAGDVSGMTNIALQNASAVPAASATATSVCCAYGSGTGCTAESSCASNQQMFVQVNTSAKITPPISYPAIGLPATVTISASSNMPVVQPAARSS